MKESPLSHEERALDTLVSEAKAHLEPPPMNFDALEARMMRTINEIESKDSPVRELRPQPGPRASSSARVFQIGAVAMAAAVAFLVIGRREQDSSEPAITMEPSAGSLRSSEGPGEVRIAGVSAVAGQSLHGGDLIEAEGVRAIFERPRKVTWVLENEHGIARARVKSASESLVVGLEEGSIEAQVTPVASGEAFAIDLPIGPKVVRIAVHGTHLRVTRTPEKISIDLTEGVVSIGAPPRTGSTYGTLVTAPAHVELDPNDPDAMKVDHGAAAVRPAISLPHVDPPTALAKDTPQNTPIPKVPAAPTPPKGDAVANKVDAPPKTNAVSGRDAVVQAVKDCAKGRAGEPRDVKVTISSMLRLKVAGTGEIQSALFDPPLSPEIQSCAAAAIYKVKLRDLEEGGAISLPIEITY